MAISSNRQSLVRPSPQQSESGARGIEKVTLLRRDREERPAAVRQKAHSPESEPRVSLPLLATANDIRELVKFLKKKPAGATIVEAMDALKKRALDPRKIAAYEYWGIISRRGDRLKLSPLGEELARRLEPEAQIFRTLLNRTIFYRSVLEWADCEQLELVTHDDVAGYWREHHAEAIESSHEKVIEGNVISFFHLCQAAELGVMTVGKKGQPARLRVDRAELEAYLTTTSLAVEPLAEDENAEPEPVTFIDTKPPPPAALPPEPCRVFISHRNKAELADQLRVSLELADIASEIIERSESGARPLADRMFQAMRACQAGLIVVTDEDCCRDETGQLALKQSVLLEISAAFALYHRQLLLLWDQRVPVPDSLQGLSHCTHGGGALSWETGVQLVKMLKDFKSQFQCEVRR